LICANDDWRSLLGSGMCFYRTYAESTWVQVYTNCTSAGSRFARLIGLFAEPHPGEYLKSLREGVDSIKSFIDENASEAAAPVLL